MNMTLYECVEATRAQTHARTRSDAYVYAKVYALMYVSLQITGEIFLFKKRHILENISTAQTWNRM